MSTKIYTKTGDLGRTSLIGGTKVPKSNIRIESYGTVDELNSFIGLAGDYLPDNAIKGVLKEIQDRLFTIGSSLACDPDKELLMKIPDLKEEDVRLLENEMDKMNEILPAMKNFSIYSFLSPINTSRITLSLPVQKSELKCEIILFEILLCSTRD